MLIKGNCSECREYGDLQPSGSSFRKGICEKCIDKAKREIQEEKERVERERRARIRATLAPVLEMLNRGDFLNADQFILGNRTEEISDEYERIKFEEHIGKDLRGLENEL